MEKSYEEQQMEALVGSTGWKMVVEKLKERKEAYTKQLLKPLDQNLNREWKELMYAYWDRLRDIITEIDYLLVIPEEIINDNKNENFTVEM